MRQSFQAVASCKAVEDALAVLPDPSSQIAGYADIERTLGFVGHDVDIAAHHL